MSTFLFLILILDMVRPIILELSKVKTQYAFILNPDAYLDQNTLQELSDVRKFIKRRFLYNSTQFK